MKYDVRRFCRITGLKKFLVKSYVYIKYRLTNREVLALLDAPFLRAVLGLTGVRELKDGRHPTELHTECSGNEQGDGPAGKKTWSSLRESTTC